MIEPSQLLYFVAASAALTLLPGPDILFVLTQSISQGKMAGVATASGLCTGVLAHTTAAALGVSAIVYQSALAFAVLKYAGAAYLLYLAWKALGESDQILSSGPVRETDVGALYKRGIFMNLLNPKVALFFLAFLPQFVNLEAGSVPMQMIVLGIIFMVQAWLIFTVISVFAGTIGNKILERPGIGKYINWGKAGIFTAIGVQLAISHK
ncbi:LysE family translocator [Methanosarcina sp. KYL-1]|uniref:LysE family translocator n=1 Tax=Methanosarcina sp. KYL-1 TaxID=2602068 RepID=UPI002100F1F9|nr:LysE family translocator [Methanosarcina sp. KYL-1]MCQ1536519.1 LysE family translocator [Methanosarcina sp. KYL-1]